MTKNIPPNQQFTTKSDVFCFDPIEATLTSSLCSSTRLTRLGVLFECSIDWNRALFEYRVGGKWLLCLSVVSGSPKWGQSKKRQVWVQPCKLGGVFLVIDPAQVAPDSGAMFKFGAFKD